MAKTDTIRARVEPDLKREAESLFKRLGLSPTEAIRLFYRQVTLRRGLPFEVKVPNETTRKAMQEARANKGLSRYRSLDELKADLQ